VKHVALLRGINIGPANRISMPELRAALEEAGYEDVATYLQSGNVVFESPLSAPKVVRAVEELVRERFGLEIPVVVRSAKQLAEVVRRDPLGKEAADPKRYQVSFLDRKLSGKAVERLEAAAGEGERLEVSGREVYAWHPEGVARSKLWALLAGTSLGVTATSRNWTTVTKLVELAEG
jgi:uncharacterized protein (DUF1697 family)